MAFLLPVKVQVFVELLPPPAWELFVQIRYVDEVEMARRFEDDDEEMFNAGKDLEKSFHLLKTDNELFNEQDNRVQKTIAVRRIDLPRRGEDWEILENGKIVLKLKGTRFTNSEKQYLRSVDGMKYLMATYKTGNKSVVKIKKELKKLI